MSKEPKRKNPKTEKPDVPEAEVIEAEPVAGASANDEAAALRDQNLRLRAEYDNFRRRSQKEREQLYTDVRADTAAKLLPVLDNLERAVAAPCQDTGYAQGVEMTLKQCHEIFESLGIKAYGAAGEAFDPNIHNAVMHVEEETLGENVIAEVFQTGYILGEKVLRFAMVKVAN